MPKRLSISKLEVMPVESAKANVVEFPSPVKVKNPAAVALGKLGGSKGGKMRAAKLSAEERKAIAQKAAQSRWAKSDISGKPA